MSEETSQPECSNNELFQQLKAVKGLASWGVTISGSALVTLVLIGVSDHFLLQKHTDQIADLKHATENTTSDHEAVAYMRPKVEGLWWASKLSKENP